MQKISGQIKWQCRWSPTLGELESTHQEVWGTDDYIDRERPTVFMGIYSFNDFIELWRHKGEKAILWCGSDIRHFRGGYWLDKTGEFRLSSERLARWIANYCDNWVENDVERLELKKFGIWSRVCPSFLGDVSKFEISYKSSSKPKLYASVSGDDFELYRWQQIADLASDNPGIEFHLFGNTKPYISNKGLFDNLYVHGRIPKEHMNKQIKEMQGALRLLPMEGFSEIIAKSVLMGQWPISAIKYPYMLSVDEIGTLKDRKEPNIEGRNYYIKELNKFPWNTNA